MIMKKYIVFITLLVALILGSTNVFAATPFPLGESFLTYSLNQNSNFVGVVSNGTVLLAEEPAKDFKLPLGFTKYIVTGRFEFMQDQIPSCCVGAPGSTCFDCSKCYPTATIVPTITPVPTVVPTTIPTFTPTPVITITPVVTPIVLNKCGGAWGAPCTCISGATEYTRGCTVAGVYYRETDGQKVLLTNAHCIYRPTPKGIVDYKTLCTVDNTGKCVPYRWYFPSPVDGGTYSPGYGWFGWPVSPAVGSTQYYDAGVVKIDSPTWKDSNLCMLTQQTKTSEPYVGERLLKNGRTTGFTDNEVIAVNTCVKVGTGNVVFNFCGQTVLISKTSGKDPMSGGDSGSLFVDKNDPTKAVCLGFAGSEQGYAICSPMSRVMGGLHISFSKP
jgi:hypothetical protein